MWAEVSAILDAYGVKLHQTPKQNALNPAWEQRIIRNGQDIGSVLDVVEPMAARIADQQRLKNLVMAPRKVNDRQIIHGDIPFEVTGFNSETNEVEGINMRDGQQICVKLADAQKIAWGWINRVKHPTEDGRNRFAQNLVANRYDVATLNDKQQGGLVGAFLQLNHVREFVEYGTATFMATTIHPLAEKLVQAVKDFFKPETEPSTPPNPKAVSPKAKPKPPDETHQP